MKTQHQKPEWKLYVIVRRDLSRSQQAVQACHAVAEYVRLHDTEWDNGTMVLLGVDDEHNLLKWIDILKENEICHSFFVEPDYSWCDRTVTAVAFVVKSNKSGLFRDLPLL